MLFSTTWMRRWNIISWTIFIFILFLLQMVFLFSQLATESSSKAKGTQRIERLNPQFLEKPRLNPTALRHILEQILRQKARPPDSVYNFNVNRSDSIPLDRDINDTRPVECLGRSYPFHKGITASVIVIFYNEALTVLLRTIHSIIKRSPTHILKEIIMVDDFSSIKDLGSSLETYVAALDPRVRIMRNKKRQGLVRSRLRGADNATGDILVWLDAHTECNVGWLEPLVYELTQNPVTIVQPQVDVIEPTTIDFFAYPGDMYRGGFGWDLRYAWYKLPKYLSQSRTSVSDPFPTPVLVGCAIAARKDHFEATGRFDSDLNIWGGEHFDLSFRTWLCGGRILTVPCSRVGHMFKEFTYSFNGDRATVIRKNLMRIADIWLDEYKWIFDAVSLVFGPEPAITLEEQHSRLKRKKLRRHLKCKPFRWFLEHIMPEIKVPSVKDNYFGELTNVKTSQCWTPLDDGYIGMTGECFKYRLLPENHFSLDNQSNLLHDQKCLYMDDANWLLRKRECKWVGGDFSRPWIFQPITAEAGQLQYQDNNVTIWCAKHVTNITPTHYGQQMVQMTSCNPEDPYQLWSFTYILNKT